MLANNLLEKIGFTPKMQDDYNKFKAVADEKIFLYAEEFFFWKDDYGRSKGKA